MFEKATRMKLRFAYKGLVSVEDLWDLKLSDLDSVYVSLKKKRNEHSDSGLLKKKDSKLSILDLKLDIVEHIFNTKLSEWEQRKSITEKRAKKDRLLHILADKQDEELKSKSMDELTKMIDEL